MTEKLKYIRKYLKFIILIIILAAIALGAYIVIKRLTRKDKTEKHIQIESVQRAMFMERITELGDLEALEEVEIKSDVSGVIKELYVDNGDYVEKGQELFKIDDEYIKQRLKATQAEYDVASGQVEQARIEKDLEIKRIKNSIETAQKNLELAKANLESVAAMGEQQILQAQNILKKLETETSNKYKTEHDQAKLALAQAQLSLKTAKASLDIAESESERYKKLIDQKFISRSQYESIQKKLTEAQAAYETAEGEVKSAKLGLEYAEGNLQQLREDIADQKENIAKIKQSAEAQKTEAKLRVDQQSNDLKSLLAAEEDQQRNANLKVLSAEKYKERSEAELNRLKEELSWTVKHAPRSGTINGCLIKVGQAVASGRSEWGGGEPIMKISDLSQMVVKAYVNEIEIRNVQKDQRAEIRVKSYQDRTFDGKVYKIAPSARMKDNIRSFEVTVLITNVSNELRPQMTADVDIIVSERNGILQMPISALIESDATLVYARIPEKEIGKFHKGQKVNLKLPNNEKLFPSEVITIPDAKDTRYIDNQVIYEICIRVDNNPNEFNWGPPVPMDIILDAYKLSKVISIVNKTREPYALRVLEYDPSATGSTEQIKTQKVRLVIGKRNESNIEIIEGLREGDRVELPEQSRKDLFEWED